MSFCCDAHPSIKTGIVACLRDRAENTDGKHARMEKKHLKKVFLANRASYTRSCTDTGHHNLHRRKLNKRRNRRYSFPIYSVSQNTYEYADRLE